MLVIEVMLGVAGAIALAALTAVTLFVGAGNRLVALDARCDTAFADIDAHLKHRHNLVPGMVEVAKGATGHEREILLGLGEARARAIAAIGPAAKLEAERDLSQHVTTLLAGVEKHPELRAMPEFGRLREQLVECENRITASRRFYNLAIEEYNVALRQFPGSLIADRRRLTRRQPYDLGVERILVDEPLSFAF